MGLLSEQKAEKGKKKASEEQTPHGELTQRLVAGPIDGGSGDNADKTNLIKEGEEATDENAGGDDADRTNLIKSPNVSNAEELESQVELIV